MKLWDKIKEGKPIHTLSSARLRSRSEFGKDRQKTKYRDVQEGHYYMKSKWQKEMEKRQELAIKTAETKLKEKRDRAATHNRRQSDIVSTLIKKKFGYVLN